MKIALLGTRGVPASYSGFETCAEAIGRRLVARGHQVTVYCRPGRTGFRGPTYGGMRRVTLPAIPTKGLETLTHSALSTVHAVLRERPDAAVVFGVGNAIYARPLRWAGIPVAINVDGADWARQKWGGLGRRYLRWSERVATRSANAIIADSHAVAEYYERTYGARCTYIPYGADVPAGGLQTLARFGLIPRRYFLAVGRFVPENGFHHLIRAYRRVTTDLPFVLVGDAPYSDAYKRTLRELASPSVIFTGYQFGDAYHDLSAHAFAFLLGAEVGGTHPVLLEQMGHGNCVVARWTESNAEVLDDAGLFFRDPDAELPRILEQLLADPGLVAETRERARRRSLVYSWDRVTDGYEQLLAGLRPAASPHAAGG
ncbi:MAG TPA: glycosyltransferase [Candidatus Sulfotelmatobacter sp.]|nr:glycosyltransferase [Candidatus Sulfotelmatobacter sp.]